MVNMPYKILEHTADVGIIAEGRNFTEALEESARGMFSFMGSARPIEKLKIEVHREREDEMVVFFLSEILAQCEGQGFTPADVKIGRYEGGKLSATIFGEIKTLKNIIKAVTFHMLEVKKGANSCSVQVLFDI